MSVQLALDQLATFRAQNSRSSQDVLEKGTLVLEKNALYKMGDESTSLRAWSSIIGLTHVFRLGISGAARARCDRRRTVGRRGCTLQCHTRRSCSRSLTRTAQRCLRMLNSKFSDSPRVDCLTGIRMEATEAPDIALKFYAELLEADPTNTVLLVARCVFVLSLTL